MPLSQRRAAQKDARASPTTAPPTLRPKGSFYLKFSQRDTEYIHESNKGQHLRAAHVTGSAVTDVRTKLLPSRTLYLSHGSISLPVTKTTDLEFILYTSISFTSHTLSKSSLFYLQNTLVFVHFLPSSHQHYRP